MLPGRLSAPAAAGPAAALRVAVLGLTVFLSAAAAQPSVWRLEEASRGRPAELADALAAAADGLPLNAPERFELEVARGMALARTQQAQQVEDAARQLEAPQREPPALGAFGATLVRAHWLSRHGTLKKADRLLTEGAASLAAQPGLPDGIRLRYLALHSDVKEGLAEFDAALAHGHAAVTLAERIAPPWRRVSQRSDLAYTVFQARQFDRALAMARDAQAQAGAVGDPLTTNRANTVLGIVAGHFGHKDEELRALHAAIESAQAARAPREEAVAAANLSDHYLQSGHYATALELARRALPLTRLAQDSSGESVALANAGLASIALGQREEGTGLVREALLIEERNGSMTGMSQIQGELARILEASGHLAEAWTAHAEYRRLSDEVYRRDHQNAVLEQQEGFDAERRAREIRLLHSQTALKQEQLRGRDLAQRVWAASSLAGLLLVAVVALLLLRMRRSNALLARSNLRLKEASRSDPLTGLANRRHFQAVMAQSGATQALQGSLLLLDLDHFKRINDRHGHATGDAVLVETARRLRATLRDSDLTVRWGGEEFLIVVTALPADEVEGLAERLLAAVGGEPVRAAGHCIDVTASIGFATFPLPPAHADLRWEQAIDLVDKAMYLAKAHGRNRAYGLRWLQLDDGAEPVGPALLESAWRAGRADLRQFAGPKAVAATSP